MSKSKFSIGRFATVSGIKCNFLVLSIKGDYCSHLAEVCLSIADNPDWLS